MCIEWVANAHTRESAEILPRRHANRRLYIRLLEDINHYISQGTGRLTSPGYVEAQTMLNNKNDNIVVNLNIIRLYYNSANSLGTLQFVSTKYSRDLTLVILTPFLFFDPGPVCFCHPSQKKW